MNIALTSLVIITLLLPGIIYRRFYYSEEFSKQYFKATAGDLIISTVFPTIFIHFICLSSFVYPEYKINFDVLGTLLSGSENSLKVEYAFKNLGYFKIKILKYFLVAIILATILGILSKFLVRKLRLDRRFKLLRFQNEWHYLFSGEILDFPRIDGEYEEISFVYLDVLVKTDDGPMIYMGILSDYILSKDGGIDRIYLSETKRRKLSDDIESDEKYYHMPGNFFVIPYNQVINLHLLYYQVTIPRNIVDHIVEEDDSINREDLNE